MPNNDKPKPLVSGAAFAALIAALVIFVALRTGDSDDSHEPAADPVPVSSSLTVTPSPSTTVAVGVSAADRAIMSTQAAQMQTGVERMRAVGLAAEAADLDRIFAACTDLLVWAVNYQTVIGEAIATVNSADIRRAFEIVESATVEWARSAQACLDADFEQSIVHTDAATELMALATAQIEAIGQP